MSEVSIPVISDEELMKRYQQIKPLIRVDGKLYYLREFDLDDVRGSNYLANCKQNIAREVKGGELKVLKGKEFVCLHTYLAPVHFMPTISEVLSQIKEEDLPIVKAFELDDWIIGFKDGHHVSTIILYG